MSDVVEEDATLPETNQQSTKLCRICYAAEEEEKLVAPCKCAGSVQYIHQSCLLTWLRSSTNYCELCQSQYQFYRKMKPMDERLSPKIGTWHFLFVIKELVFLDWFHFLETVFICISLIAINRMSSFDLVYQFALIGIVELLYYSLNIFSCLFLLYYQRWSRLNVVVDVLEYTDIESFDQNECSWVITALENFTAFLKKNRRLQLVITHLEESDA